MSPEREYTHGHQGREKVLCAPNRQIEATARRHRAPAGITVPRQTSGGTRGRGGGGRGPAHAAAGDGSTEGPQSPKPEPPCGPAGSSGYRAKEPDQDLRDTSPPTPRAAPPRPPRAGANPSSIPRRAGERNRHPMPRKAVRPQTKKETPQRSTTRANRGAWREARHRGQMLRGPRPRPPTGRGRVRARVAAGASPTGCPRCGVGRAGRGSGGRVWERHRPSAPTLDSGLQSGPHVPLGRARLPA